MLRECVSAIALAASLVLIGACSSTSSGTGDSAGTTLAGDTTLAGETTTSAAPGTVTTLAGSVVATLPAATTAVTTTPTAPPTAPRDKAAHHRAARYGSGGAEDPELLDGALGGCGVPPAPDVSFTVPPTKEPTLKISWAATGSDSVYVAIDNQDGVDEQGLPLNGSYEFTLDCGGSHTYWVVAVKGSAKDYKSATFP